MWALVFHKKITSFITFLGGIPQLKLGIELYSVRQMQVSIFKLKKFPPFHECFAKILKIKKFIF